MKKAPNLWALKVLQNEVNNNQTEINGKWIPARPLGVDCLRHRLRLAWGIFLGKYDAVKWPGGQ